MGAEATTLGWRLHYLLHPPGFCRLEGQAEAAARIRHDMQRREEGRPRAQEDGSIVTWGNVQSGGGPPPCTGAVQSISATDAAFAALTRNSGVHAWGDPAAGGHPNEVSADLAGGVLAVFGCKCAFAAMKHDGSVVCWGAAIACKGFDRLRCKLGNMQVRHIASTSNAFAALTAGGSVFCWGDPVCGGDSSGVDEHLQDNIAKIYSNEVAFAALKHGGAVVPWGGHYLDMDLCYTGQHLDAGVEQVVATRLAFAGLKSDGSVVTWGHRNRGGDSSAVARQLGEVRKVCASDNAFAAVTASGAVITWGVKDEGGNYCSADELLESDVHDVHSTCNAFMAIKYDGSVVAWGGRRFGGHVPASAVLRICSGDEKRELATSQQLVWQAFCVSSNRAGLCRLAQGAVSARFTTCCHDTDAILTIL